MFIIISKSLKLDTKELSNMIMKKYYESDQDDFPVNKSKKITSELVMIGRKYAYIIKFL